MWLRCFVLSVLFYVFFVLGVLTIAIMNGSEIIYYSQLNGYKISSLWRNFYDKVKDNLLNIFMCIVIIVTMYIVDFQNIYYELIYLLVTIGVWGWAGNQFEYIKKIKYTKRAIRQSIVFLILTIAVSILFCYIHSFYLTIGFPLCFFLNYIIYFLTIVLLFPIEKLIGTIYLSKAKKKLRKHNKLIKIGITGSFGKTSVKEILNSILSQEYYTLATPKSYNTPFGISKTINENLENAHEIFICEMGAKKRGEINELCKLVDVDLGIVTAVGRQHLSTFGSVENIYKTKKELPDYLYKKLCVFNLMNFYTSLMYKDFVYQKIGVFILKHRSISASKFVLKNKQVGLIAKQSRRAVFCEYSKINNVYAKNIKAYEAETTFDLNYNGKFVCSVSTTLLGVHNVINILLASALAIVLNVSSLNIARGVKNLKSINARLEKRQNENGAIIINNGYNSNIDSAPYALGVLKLFDVKNKVVVTPGLIECKDDYKCNYEFGKLIAKHATEVIVVKKKNRQAIVDGLKSQKFASQKIHTVDSFESVREVLNKSTKDYVFLIENDLPDNFR